MKFYTHFTRQGNYILERGYDNGKRYKNKVDYNPTLFVLSPKEKTKYKTLDGRYVTPLEMGSMREASDFMKQYEDVDSFSIFGSTNYPYVYINEQFPNEVIYDTSILKVANIDIEVGSENGFPEPSQANEPITAITIKTNGHYYVMGCGDYTNTRTDVTYTKCNDESALIMKFIETWEFFDFDIVTGWNIQFFDIPYLYNRILRLMGENTAKRLSPWRLIGERTTTIHNKQQVAFDLTGIAILDYLELYKKFTYSQQESFRLDHIAYIELGEKKLDYSEFENLHQLYKLDYQKFIDYNIKDVHLVDRLDDKMKFIDMVLALAYDAKVNLTDVFTQVRMWDTLTHNHLIKQNIVVPQKKTSHKDEKYEGAYVKDPIIGKHQYVASFDLNSLYPHLMMQYSISPESLVERSYVNERKHKLILELRSRKL